MAEKIKKTIPWFIVLTLFVLVAIVAFNFNKSLPQEVRADNATTTVTVGNAAPSWTAVYESPLSSSSTPTNAGSAVTFVGRATDPNSDSWYLIVCSTSTTIATTTGGVCPVCPGTGTTYATATAASNATATANYTTLAGNPQQNDWWAWACDNNSAQLCSAYSQGTGGTLDAYSPFVVNHAPVFSALANSGPVNPAATITFLASSTDSDSYGGNDTIIFTVCKTVGVTGTWCTGATWCTTTAASNPNCSTTVPDPTAAGTQNYYPYIFDNHGFAATSTTQGTLQTYTVNNVSPQVSGVTLNGGADINLSVGGPGPNGSTTKLATANIVDHNGCSDVATVTVKAYPSGIGAGGCTAQNNNTCYYNLTCTAGPCQGNGYTATTSCSISFQYHSDPTDNNTPRAAEKWLDTIFAQDSGGLSSSTEITTGVEVISYLALTVSSPIAYGNLSVGQITDSTNLPQTATTTNVGNTGLNVGISGTLMCTDYPTCAGNSIATSSQRYATTSIQYVNSNSLTEASTELDIKCLKTTTTASPQQKANYWGIQIATGTVPGTYTGRDTYSAIESLPADW